MPHDRAADPAQQGLSTEDIAQPQPAEASATEPPQPPPETPTHPGEAIATDTSQPRPQETGEAEEAPQLLTAKQAEDFNTRWQEIQNRFVDDPRDAVHSADALVADVMQTLATTFADHKQQLEDRWKRGEEMDTEGLRMALRHYRFFFNRLLAE
ncbi:hypothetical protein [Streptomyces decoyicus]|uniref:hypothetical protein n=1 Tax=Streptomyces decoyicus TaxID=249567 RepID=UPI0004AA1F83|nr:hypothetical protein [Streptomyces decoyicus]KOG41305.1 hypothetical protein ADK74_22600 [Streptomyces decoyicus]QZY20227.1 hypothetical protein K7C20_37700 [Streptomyces decoyicus]